MLSPGGDDCGTAVTGIAGSQVEEGKCCAKAACASAAPDVGSTAGCSAGIVSDVSGVAAVDGVTGGDVGDDAN